MPIFFPIFLYAETHYRFKYFFSFLKKREPEILADLPHRLEPTAELPILLLVKDADHYPVEIMSVSISLRHETTGRQFSQLILTDSASVNEPLWWKVVHVPWDETFQKSFGAFFVDIYFEYKINNKLRRCKNDNYRTASKRSYCVFRSPDPLPSFPGWILGDTHTHSSYTNDQVEFGSPIGASVELCKAMGLSFFCVTDHSYDLDDRIDNYLVNDPQLPKWKLQQNEIDEFNNSQDNFAVVRGEEVSVWNHALHNVHLLLWGTRTFFHGSGDSAERWFHTNAEHTISDVLDKKEPATVAYAAHPAEPAPLLQRLFIGRGEWTLDDMRSTKLAGLQILNGETGIALEQGLSAWKKLLLEGKRIYIAAGNDAHGNFNRFKQIKIPFLKIIEADKQLFGRMRTAVQCETISETTIVEALRSGRTVITNGPIVTFSIEKKNDIAKSLSTAQSLIIRIKGISTNEFGAYNRSVVYVGKTGDAAEIALWEIPLNDEYSFELNRAFDFSPSNIPHYFRIEAYTHNGAGINENGFCHTNPVWLEQ